ncbi:MAG TPA: hypothetical protein P5059_01755, partial [Candidatus Dojkabacteria bacterium]|nr:hypothetical protein [Candidatus Dojkabacteria bacterium]
NNNACYICQKEIQNGYYVAKWVQTSKFAAEGTKCYEVVEEEEEEEEDNENELTDNNQGSNQNLEAGDEIRSWLPVTGRNYDGTMITPGERLCTDVDGCTCIWNYNIKPGETTLNIDNNYTCKIDEEKGYISPEGDENMDENYTSYLPIITNISCLGSTLKDGDECNIDSSIAFLLGTWDSSTCSCKLNKKIEGASCFESNQLYFKNLTFWEDGKRLACIGGEMKEWQGSNLNAECKKDSYCAYSGIRERCLSSDDLTTLLYCDYTTLTWQTEKNDKSDYFKISSIPLVDTLENEQCKNAYCICHSGQDHLLNEYEWCVDKFSCAPLFNTNGVCNKSGNTCNFYEGKYHCDGPVNSSLNKPAIKLLSNSIVPKAFAQASETEEYIIDSSTGLISGIASGIYTFELDGITYMFFVDEEALGANNGKILIFIDNDNNGIYDEGTDTKVSELASKIAISTIQKEYSYKLKQGFNFVSFPFLNVTESARTALGLLEMLNTLTNGSVYSIAKFDSSWEIVGKNGDTYLSNDFQLIPGQGYVIKVIKDVEVSIQGYPIKFESDEDSAPITLFTGWNLIGVYGTKAKVYTAKTLLQDINSFEEINFTADIVNGWDQDAQSYEGFVLENTNGIESEYGFDFPINTLKSYFVRVADGKGNWQPSLAE